MMQRILEDEKRYIRDQNYEIGQGRNELYFRIDGLFPKLRRSELAGMVAKIVAGDQSRAVKVQQIPNEKVGTYWIRIY